MILSLIGNYSEVIDVRAPAYGAIGDGVIDDTAALQAAVNAAIAANKPLYLPAGLYKYTPPLTINGNVSIIGAWVSGNWNNNINVPSGSPALFGSVLYPAANGSDAISISGTSLTVHISNIGILFQTTFGQSSTTTGDGIHYVATTTQGLSGSEWENVWVYGHDGNHYAYNLGNLIYNNFYDCFSYGGGGWNIAGNGISGNYGNSTFVGLQNQVLVGGTAYGIVLTSTSINNLNLLQFINPQVNIVNQIGVTPAANPPTSAQLALSVDANSTYNSFSHSDFSGNISGRAATVYIGHDNSYDFIAGFWDVVVSSPSWGIFGATQGGNPVTFTDTTSSGTVAEQTFFSIPAPTLKASSAMTATILSTLRVPVPIASTNVTATRNCAIHTAGEIFSDTDISCLTTVNAGAAVSAYNTTSIPAGGSAGKGFKLSNTSNFGVFFGSGAPALAAAKGSLYLRSDGSTTNDRMYVNTDGSTTWTAVTTAT